MSYNYLEEASGLAIEYTQAFLGSGYEYFDLPTPMGPTSPPVYYPHNHMQTLLELLNEDASPQMMAVSMMALFLTLLINFFLKVHKKLQAAVQRFKDISHRDSLLSLQQP